MSQNYSSPYDDDYSYDQYTSSPNAQYGVNQYDDWFPRNGGADELLDVYSDDYSRVGPEITHTARRNDGDGTDLYEARGYERDGSSYHQRTYDRGRSEDENHGVYDGYDDRRRRPIGRGRSHHDLFDDGGYGYDERDARYQSGRNMSAYNNSRSFPEPRSRTYSNRSGGSSHLPYTPPRKTTIQPEKIPVPSSSYLQLAAQPSTRIPDATQRRKLIILDLNGTILFRVPRPRSNNRDPYASNDPRPLRTTHPRPYMASFRAFLFHPETRKWLDTMVWSSAQFVNVKDMVRICFGEEQVANYVDENQEAATDTRVGLVAIWDRALLGLNEHQFRNKTQTTKNLAKPWDLLPISPFSGPDKQLSDAWDKHAAIDDPETAFDMKTFLATTTACSADDDIYSKDDSLPKSSPTLNAYTRNELLAHSAMSTLLLDDSPLKARLQPYNHICVPEYEKKLRARDLSILHSQNDVSTSYIPGLGEGEAHREDAVDDPPRAPEKIDVGTGKRKRSRSSSPQSSPIAKKRLRGPQRQSGSTNLSKSYDHVLLAVIGILDALKHESNVAAWVKGQGLFAADHSEHDALDVELFKGDLETRAAVAQKDEELDEIYLKSVPEGVGTPNPTPGSSSSSRKKPRWDAAKRRERMSGSGLSASGLEPDSPAFDSVEGSSAGAGNDLGVSGEARLSTDSVDGFEVPGLNFNNRSLSSSFSFSSSVQSQNTEGTQPASRVGSPDSDDMLNSSYVSTQPPSSAGKSSRLHAARIAHLMPRQERRGPPPTSSPVPRAPTPSPVPSAVLYGEDGENVASSNPAAPEHRSLSSMGSDFIDKDLYSRPRAISTPVDRADPLAVSDPDQSFESEGTSNLLPLLWYQHPPARWYWVLRGVRALKDLGLDVVAGV